jgi:hypothetical protein
MFHGGSCGEGNESLREECDHVPDQERNRDQRSCTGIDGSGIDVRRIRMNPKFLRKIGWCPNSEPLVLI